MNNTKIIKIQAYDIARQNNKYGIIVEVSGSLYFKDLHWISGVSYKGEVLDVIQEDILKVSNESFIRFLLYSHPNLKKYISNNEELKHILYS